MKQIDTETPGYKKFKRVMAVVAIVLLVAMYVVALVAACCNSEYSHAIFMTAMYSTFVIPVIIYLLQLFYKLGHRADNEKKQN